VIALHVDQSVKDAKDGLNYTAVFAGSHKNDFSPHEPLSPQAGHRAADRGGSPLRHLRESGRTDARNRSGCRARHRGGAVFYGEQAVAAGLADAVMPFEQVMTEFTDALAAKQRLAQPAT
jgi:ClpP class serine protease